MASQLLAEGAIQNDNSGQLVSVINADTSTAKINNAKVQGLVNLGTSVFSGYPLKVGTDIPAANESNYVANDNTGNLVGIINADTSTAKISNSKLAGNLVSSITAGTGIAVTNPTGVGAATVSVSGVPNSALSGPLLSAVTAGTGITVTGNPASGVGSPTVSVTTAAAGGIPITRARALETELTATTATTITSYTPTATSLFMVNVFVRVVTAATAVTVTVTYDDGAATAQTDTMLPTTTLAVGNYALVPLFIAAGTAAAITVSATAGTANQVYVSASIVEL